MASLYEPAITSGESYPLINGIAAIHMAYNNMEKEFFWVAELSDNYPDLPVKLVELYNSDTTAILMSSKRMVDKLLIIVDTCASFLEGHTYASCSACS